MLKWAALILHNDEQYFLDDGIVEVCKVENPAQSS